MTPSITDESASPRSTYISEPTSCSICQACSLAVIHLRCILERTWWFIYCRNQSGMI